MVFYVSFFEDCNNSTSGTRENNRSNTTTGYFYLVVAANGEEARGGASSAHTVWNYCGKLAGQPHPEGVSEGFLPGASGHALPGCWTGRKNQSGWGGVKIRTDLNVVYQQTSHSQLSLHERFLGMH